MPLLLPLKQVSKDIPNYDRRGYCPFLSDVYSNYLPLFETQNSYHDVVFILKEKDHFKNINMLSEMIKTVINTLAQLPLENGDTEQESRKRSGKDTKKGLSKRS